MADEKKVDAETTTTETAEKPESSEQSEKEGEHIDYQALYEDEKGRREKAESIIQRHKEKPKSEDEEQSESPAIDVDSIRSILREEVEGLRSSLASQFRAKEISDAISKIASDGHHAALIRYHLDNSVRLTGDLNLDVENAAALANKKRVQSQLEEIQATLDSKGARSSGSTVGRKPKVEAEDDALPPLTDADKKVVNSLREEYVLSNAAIRRIIKGETMDSLLASGVVKRR